MITKQELLKFVQWIPEHYFDPHIHDEKTGAHLIADMLYLKCCGGIAFARVTIQHIKALGYDVSWMTPSDFGCLAAEMKAYVDINNIIIAAFDARGISPNEKDDDEDD